MPLPEDRARIRTAARNFVSSYSNCYLLWQHAWENYAKKWSTASEDRLIRAMEILEEEWTVHHEAHKCEVPSTTRPDILRAQALFNGTLISPDPRAPLTRLG